MKTISLFVLFVAVSTAHADHYKCAEKKEDALKGNRNQYAVFLTTVSTVAQNKGGYDTIERVRVSILSRNPRVPSSKFAPARKTFIATAKSADVMYNIVDREHGFSLGIYMDELDQSWMKLSTIRNDIRLNCSNGN